MKIIDMLRQEKPSLSFEVFPPKAADKYDSVEAAAAEIAKLKPSFMSITYGAGGGTSQYTVDIASTIQNTYHVNALAHLTCVSSTREHVRGVLDRIRENGLENVLALRGDLPENGVLVFVFYDGHTVTKTWDNPSRRHSWNPENRQRARELALRQAAERRLAKCQQ